MSEQLELDIDDTEEEQTEEGLEEVIKKNEERNQRDYEENKYRNRELQRRAQERKNQQLDLPGILEAGSGFRQTASIATEVLLESGMDLFSVAAPLQVPASAVINALAQKIRGGEFSRGEQLASMAATLLPGGAQGKALARFTKATGKGAVSGGIQTISQTVVDEGRRPTMEEFGTGVGTGAAFGGLFQTAASTKQVQEFAKRVRTEGAKLSDEFMAPFRVAFGGDLIGAAKFGGTSSGAKGKKAKTYPVTKARDLALYGAEDDMFEEVPDLLTAVQEGAPRGGRYVKIVDKFGGDTYHTVFTRAGKTQVLPYNTWYSKNVNPFMVPKALLTKLKKFEGGQQGNLLKVTQKGTKLTQANPGGLPTVKVPVGTKGKFKTVVAPTKFPKGTVDEFNDWYKGVFKLQKEEQALNRQVSIMLEKLGNIQARNPGKKVFDTDLSHIAPRSKGGSGLTFQEAWILNQQRGATDILDNNLLAAAGIPKNWEELFYYWLAQKKPGRELQTAIGPLSQINVDDYFALSKGEALNVVGKRRKDIRNLVNRQIGNKETYRLAGKRGTIQDDFEAAVRASKAGQVGGDIFLNDKLLDIRWVAENFDDLLEIGDI
jgi:hypothetical protein